MKKASLTTVVLAVLLVAPLIKAAPQSVTPTDKTFVMDTAKASLAEVELGKLAVRNASNDQVKQFAQQMVDDHSKANDELKTLATSKNIMVPSDLDAQDKALHDRLAALKGDAFDREYMRTMVAGHRKVVEGLRAEATSGTDADVKAWASKTLPTVESHLKHAQETDRVVGTAGVKK